MKMQQYLVLWSEGKVANEFWAQLHNNYYRVHYLFETKPTVQKKWEVVA